MATHDGYYRQKDGLAMGSQPAPLFANLWLAKFRPVIRNNAKLFDRYMDDILRSIKKSEVQNKLSQINTLHPNLQFTLEEETEGNLPFLDMLLMHRGEHLSSSWYCKPTDTVLIMNFHVLAPQQYKRSVVGGFVHRIYRACSNWTNFHQSLQRAKTVLEKNQYPPDFYDPIIESTLEKLIAKEAGPSVDQRPVAASIDMQLKVRLEYRGHATDQFVRKLKSCGVPIQSAITLSKVKSALPSLKCQVPQMLKSRIVYQLTCPRCASRYVGKTARHLQIRFDEHRNKARQPVRMHFAECGLGKPTLDNIEILATSRGGLHLSIMEALFIRELCPAMNSKDEFRDHELTIKF